MTENQKTQTQTTTENKTQKSKASDYANALLFAHPTGNDPHTVHVVCTGFSKNDYYANLSQYEPTIPKGCEVWTINKTSRHQKADLIFMLDDLVGEYQRAPDYTSEVIEASVDTPVITTTIDQAAIEIIRSVLPEYNTGPLGLHEYPIRRVRDYLGASFAAMFAMHAGTEGDIGRAEMCRIGNDLMYLRNSVPMILAYALAINVKTLYLWGADYDHPVTGARLENDKPNCEYWVGFLRGRGVNVVIPKGSTLCRRAFGQWPEWIYGYGARQPNLRADQ